jgi:hypothetical protein
MQSLGFGNQIGGQDASADFPAEVNQAMVNENEWTLSTAPITFNINFNTAVPSAVTNLELRIYRYVDNGNNLATFVSQDDTTDDVEMIEADDTFNLIASDTFAPVQTITAAAGIPIGRFAAVIWCTNNTPADYSDDTVYDGDCVAPINHSPVYFTLTNSITQVTITWNIP